ncbi:hypothetical protein MAPG_05486 [Magnaporthiopsis poae ATCC 64411]|uniref:Heterokaryon incompatibility domain-containing protein n=1 Tax=Magnaporthiopsis poae (strain ATCC 64411 / 73-15) TaxID=644358 RepID=A0A0C4DZI4_MAGP6|nr:hypothetical protein MAPG_05486 [Magnaporthiopsis poae ATCC 64411]
MLCALCDGLSLSLLADLMKKEPVGQLSFPQEAFYQHHASIDDLLQSADSGCEICQTIVACTELQPESFQSGSHLAWVEASHKSGKSTDVKICLSSSDRSDDRPKSCYDLLSVQFGRQQGPDYSHDVVADSPSGYRTYPVPLDIIVPMECEDPPYLGSSEQRIGRFELDYDLASEHNFRIARSWIKDCIDNHECCPGSRTYDVPTRLVCVGTEEDWSDVCLVELPKGVKAQYGALSHCWGGQISKVLLKNNHQDFLKHISFSDLPRNFQDALVIAKKVGFLYLWIDSLCIIQDSDEDWATESGKMTDIYAHATLTISASVSPGGAAGIFSKYSSTPHTKGDGRNPSAAHREHTAKIRVFPKSSPDDTVLQIGPHVDPNGSTVRYTYMDRDVNEMLGENLQDVESRGALSRRAWTLQEKVLSARRLIYGKKQIYWQCPTGWASADGLPGGLGWTSTDHENLLILLHDPTLDLESTMTDELRHVLRQDYWGLVWGFSGRHLTFGKDKLPSFSGIARAYQQFFGGVYLAGLWSTDIHTGLMWDGESSDGPWKEGYRAPSWSWASQVGHVDFRTAGERDRIYRKKCLCPESPDLELLSHDVCLRDPSNPYGEITAASIVVRCHTKRLLRSRKHIWTRTEEKTLVGTHFDVCWDEFSGLRDEEIYRTTLDGEDMMLVLGIEENFADLTPIPEMEFLVIFLASTTNHACNTAPSAGHASPQSGPSTMASDEEITESLKQNMEVCSQKNSDEERPPEPREDEAEACPVRLLETAMNDISWMWTDGSEQQDTETDGSVSETEFSDEGWDPVTADIPWMWAGGSEQDAETDEGEGEAGFSDEGWDPLMTGDVMWMWAEGMEKQDPETNQPEGEAEWSHEDWDPETGDWKYFSLQFLVLGLGNSGGDPCTYRREGIMELKKVDWEYVQTWKVQEITIV